MGLKDKGRALFIDTGAFYARYIPRDDHHAAAIALWKKVQEGRIHCLTTHFVLSELVSLFVYRFGSRQALQAAREIYASHAIEIVRATQDLELKALEYLERFLDQDFSMTDALSFAVMEEKRLSTAFTFDHHFEVAGFQRFQL